MNVLFKHIMTAAATFFIYTRYKCLHTLLILSHNDSRVLICTLFFPDDVQTSTILRSSVNGENTTGVSTRRLSLVTSIIVALLGLVSSALV